MALALIATEADAQASQEVCDALAALTRLAMRLASRSNERRPSSGDCCEQASLVCRTRIPLLYLLHHH
jgi:hypothetical protein